MKNSYITLLAFLFLLIGQRTWGESVTRKVHFNLSELKCDTITGGDGQVYCSVTYLDSEYEGKMGTPQLPIIFISIPIPYSSSNISLDVVRHNVVTLTLPNKILPIQQDIPTSIGSHEKIFISCDDDVYESHFPYPKNNVRIVSIPSIKDDHRFAKVSICPIQYFPESNMIEFAQDIDITVSYSASAHGSKKSQQVQTINQFANGIGLPFYEYCIITSSALKDSFTRLISWRRQNGLNAGIVCIEEILNNPNIIGDPVSHLYDNAGKLREYLQYAYDSGITKYVLFGGNDEVLPIRYGTGNNDTWTKPTYPLRDTIHYDYKIPTDFYYSELNSNWNKDGDQYLGEPLDSLNYGGQLYVGRILCSVDSEVDNYINKLLRYELNPGNGDFSYLKRAFFQQADDMQLTGVGGEAAIVANALGGNFTTKKILQEVPGPRSSNTTAPYGKDVIDSMKVHYGYVSWFGHGHPNAITTKSNSIIDENNEPIDLYQPFGITSVDDNVPYMMTEEGNGLDCLENKNFPMIAYSVACTITPFDTFNEYTEFPNIGQSFTLGKEYGGPALIGNTRYGWVGSSYEYQKKFNNYVINEPLGKALVYARANYCYTSPYFHYPHFLAHASNLIGCPYIRLWTDIPTFFNGTLTYNSNGGTITGSSGIDTCYVGIRHLDKNVEYSERKLFYPSYGSTHLPTNCLITLTGKNRLPQIMPLTIQNDTLQGTHHLIVKDVTCGKDVRNGTQGNVIFDQASDYTFESKGTFKLTKGVTIKRGAKLKVAPSEINY